MQLYIPIILVVFGAAVIYLLNRQGLAVTKSIAAILFVFCPGRDADQVRLDSCTGWVRHVGRFHAGTPYEFTLDCRLSKGNVAVLLLDQKKRLLLKLDRLSPGGRIELEGKSRYFLRWEFQSATGQCELHWREIETIGEEAI